MDEYSLDQVLVVNMISFHKVRTRPHFGSASNIESACRLIHSLKCPLLACTLLGSTLPAHLAVLAL